MTREEFKKILDDLNYEYREEGDKIVISRVRWGGVHLGKLTSIPSGVVFHHSGSVNLNKIIEIPSGTEFKNDGDILLNSVKKISPDVQFDVLNWIQLGTLFKDPTISVFFDVFFDAWNGNIEGIQPNILLNKMIKNGLLNR
jgi:hypothetical protein